MILFDSNLRKPSLPIITRCSFKRVTYLSYWLEPTHLWLEPKNLWLEPANLWLEPTNLWLEPTNLWLEPTNLWLEPKKLWLEKSVQQQIERGVNRYCKKISTLLFKNFIRCDSRVFYRMPRNSKARS
jgi:hypothetical protein